jgi:hypothetical protein
MFDAVPLILNMTVWLTEKECNVVVCVDKKFGNDGVWKAAGKGMHL